MKFRSARHTSDLALITDFYTNIIGLQILGGFQDHNTYDGVFLGLPGHDWHLEFTISTDAPVHQPDADDLLVFYVDSAAEQEIIKQKCIDNSIAILTAKNPYWNENGFTIADPDGYGVVIALR